MSNKDPSVTSLLEVELASIDECIIKRNVPLNLHTTLRIGGISRWWAEPGTINIISAIAERSPVPYRILGGGSNTLICDTFFSGIVISTKKLNRIEFKAQHAQIKVECGVKLPWLARQCAVQGFTGLEFLSHVPGTVGGAIVNNAGLSGENTIGSKLITVEIWDGLTIRTLKKTELQLSYRSSIFLKNPRWVILSAILQLKKTSPEEAQKKISAHYQRIVAKHDHSGPNAGSVFIAPDMKLMSGLRGKSYGLARWSSKRPNWIIADNGATSGDIMRLVQEAQDSDNSLRLEWQTLGF